MKSRGCCCRAEKKPKRCFFRRAEPQSRQRAFNSELHGVYKYKQAVPRNTGGNFSKKVKF